MLLSYKGSDGLPKMLRLKSMSHARPVTIGRAQEADICIDDPKASRINAAIRYWDDIFVIRDMKSHNGTMLNKEKIEVAKLNAGDVIRVGDTEIHVAAEEGSKTDVTLVST
jgi:pSer/pThr/pTyr-binding forkhead associated (FHA) protein